jgi:ketosteroid isomerase-like protein
MPNETDSVTQATLKGLLAAFNRHDLDAIMDYFADDCVLYLPRGASPRGAAYTGKAEVRQGLATRFAGLPDVHYGDDRHWVCGDLGVSEWTITGTFPSGQRVEARGVDLLEFRQGKIIRKDSFWKMVE